MPANKKDILVAEVPRVKYKKHGVVTVPAPWAKPALDLQQCLRCLAIDWLIEATLKAWYSSLMEAQREAIESVSMTEGKIACDKFHVAKHLCAVVDKVRCQGHKALMAIRTVSVTGSIIQRT